MAATTSSDIAAALSLLFAPKLTRAINDSNVLIHLLPFRLGDERGEFLLLDGLLVKLEGPLEL